MDFLNDPKVIIALLVAFVIGIGIGRRSAGASGREERRLADQALAEENLGQLSMEQRAEVSRLLDERKLIEAVKYVRVQLSCGLKEAKDVVDRIRATE